MQWTDERRTYLFTKRRHGHKLDEIARKMSDWFVEDITEADLNAMWADMIATGWVKKKRSQLDAFRKKHAFAGENPEAEKRRIVKSNIMHLVDLKRAGHSPTRTEYVISAEGKGVRFQKADTSSYIGSSAAACAMEV